MACLWVALAYFESFWPTVGSCWAVLVHSGSFWLGLIRFG